MPFPLTILLTAFLACASAACSSEDYSIEENDSRSFVVEGPAPYVEQLSGSASIVSSWPVGDDLTLLVLACDDAGPCTGTVHGC